MFLEFEKIKFEGENDMINIDRVKKLIDQIPEIKALFRPQNFQMFAPCDRATGQRKKI